MSLALLSLLAALLSAPATQPDTPPLIALTSRRSLVEIAPDGATRPVPNTGEIETIESSAAGILATRGNEILLISHDGREPKLLFKHKSSVRFAAMSGDQQQLAFSSVEDGQIWLVQRGDGGFTRPRALCKGYGPSFSADGKSIYHEAGEWHGLSCYSFQRGRSDPFLPKYPDAHTVRCSRDGQYIAFSRDRALFLYRTSDGSIRQLTSGDAYDRFPSFTADRVIFWRETMASVDQAVSVRFDGTDERVLKQGDIQLACPVQQP